MRGRGQKSGFEDRVKPCGRRNDCRQRCRVMQRRSYGVKKRYICPAGCWFSMIATACMRNMDVSEELKAGKPLIFAAMQKSHCLLFVFWTTQQAFFNKLLRGFVADAVTAAVANEGEHGANPVPAVCK